MKSCTLDGFVGAKVKLLRNVSGLSQKELASSLDVTFQQVQKYEKGINRISASMLHCIASVFQVEVGFFFDGYDDQMKKNSDLLYRSEYMEKKETLELANAYLRIKDNNIRKSVLIFIKTLIPGRHEVMHVSQ